MASRWSVQVRIGDEVTRVTVPRGPRFVTLCPDWIGDLDHNGAAVGKPASVGQHWMHGPCGVGTSSAVRAPVNDGGAAQTVADVVSRRFVPQPRWVWPSQRTPVPGESPPARATSSGTCRRGRSGSPGAGSALFPQRPPYTPGGVAEERLAGNQHRPMCRAAARSIANDRTAPFCPVNAAVRSSPVILSVPSAAYPRSGLGRRPA